MTYGKNGFLAIRLQGKICFILGRGRPRDMKSIFSVFDRPPFRNYFCRTRGSLSSTSPAGLATRKETELKTTSMHFICTSTP